jgi:hypothetical protein
VNVEGMAEIDELSPASLREMVERIRLSNTAEQLVYRETEMDELWRLADRDVRMNGACDARLKKVQLLIHQAHDTLANAEDGAAASASLLAAAELLGCRAPAAVKDRGP